MRNLIFYHDILLIVCYFVLFFIIFFMGRIIFFSGCYFFNLGNSFLEIVWTLIPALILILLVEPSLVLLYFSEAFSFSNRQVVKVLGHQWYWSYERDYIKKILGYDVSYDSYMVSSDLQIGDFRRLEVDNPIVVFSKIPIFFLVSSRDVIHRFALPNLGLKIDAFPGRLKLGVRSGIPVGCFWGQCSEICGANHAFMPIGLEAIIFFRNIN